MRDQDYVEAVLDVVDRIPPGHVLSYGDIAEIVGRGGPRMVGRVMALHGAAVSWWRVVHADGSLIKGHEEKALLRHRSEGTPLAPSGDRIDMTRARWIPQA